MVISIRGSSLLSTDPHGGNVLVDLEAKTASFIDFGGVLIISEEHKTRFARYMVAVDDRDAGGCKDYQDWVGNEYRLDTRPDEKNNSEVCLVFVVFGIAGIQVFM